MEMSIRNIQSAGDGIGKIILPSIRMGSMSCSCNIEYHYMAEITTNMDTYAFLVPIVTYMEMWSSRTMSQFNLQQW
jgi:hypothetical protein